MSSLASLDPKLNLSYEDFERLAEDLLEKSTKLGDAWELRRVTASSGGSVSQKPQSYLVKKSTLRLKRAGEGLGGEEALGGYLDALAGDTSGLSEDADVASLNKDGSQLVEACSVHMDYHVVHSMSYQVPILYFNATYSNGQALPLADIWHLLSSEFVSEDANRWGLVTQQEHPYLGTPFYHIHPCHTAIVMGRAMQSTSAASSANYLITWLSTFAPVIGLNFPIEYTQ